MGRVTQRVAPEQVGDLLERPPRAALAFTHERSVAPVPVAYRRSDGRTWIGAARESLPAGGPPERAVLLLDDGGYWFELRAVTLRGRLLAATETPPGGDPQLAWYELVPDHAVAWDYGTLHEETAA